MDENLYTQVNVFDSSIGKYGQYTWKNLPTPMTKREARAHTVEMGWCPAEGFRNEPLARSPRA